MPTTKASLRLVHSNTRQKATHSGVPRRVSDEDDGKIVDVQLVRDLIWFSARAAEIGNPENPEERALLERYQARISHRRESLLRLGETGA